MHEIKKVISCLKELGFEPSVTKFEHRLIIQKIVHLLQLKGVKIGFDFHMYARGPYSTFLTTQIYDNQQAVEKLKTDIELTNREKQDIAELKSLFELKAGLLEIASTYAYLMTQESAYPIEAVAEVKRLKPFFSDTVIAVGISRVKEFLFKPSQKDMEAMKSEFSAWQKASVQTLAYAEGIRDSHRQSASINSLK